MLNVLLLFAVYVIQSVPQESIRQYFNNVQPRKKRSSVV